MNFSHLPSAAGKATRWNARSVARLSAQGWTFVQARGPHHKIVVQASPPAPTHAFHLTFTKRASRGETSRNATVSVPYNSFTEPQTKTPQTGLADLRRLAFNLS